VLEEPALLKVRHVLMLATLTRKGFEVCTGFSLGWRPAVGLGFSVLANDGRQFFSQR